MELLTKHIFDKNEANIIVYLLNYNTATFREIERKMNLRQPEVSIGLSRLKKLQLVKTTDVALPNGRKGRPMKKLSFSKGKEKMIAWLEQEIMKKIEKQKENLVELKQTIAKNRSK